VAGVLYSCRQGETLTYGDEFEYVAIARNILAGKGYSIDGAQPTAYRPPTYALAVTAALSVCDRMPAIRIMNFVALAAAILLAYLWLERLAGPLTGLVAALGIMGYPVVFYAAGKVFPQSLAIPLLVGGLYSVMHDPGRRLTATLAGVLFGLSGYAAPNLALLAPLLLVIPWILKRRNAAVLSLCIATGFAMVVVPWTVRNALVMGKVIPMTTSSGINLLMGNSEKTTPNAGVTVDISRYTVQASQMTEVDRDAFYRHSAWEWVSRHPAAAGSLYLKKLANFLNIRNELSRPDEQSRWRTLLLGLTFIPWLALMVIRLALWRRRPLTPVERCLVLTYLCGAATLALFYTRVRYRLPFDIVLIMLGAVTVTGMRRFRSQGGGLVGQRDVLASSEPNPMSSPTPTTKTM
jgi:4-amino-4-deoxy-L-arabinose transferase-like glycosyltransferase